MARSYVYFNPSYVGGLNAGTANDPFNTPAALAAAAAHELTVLVAGGTHYSHLPGELLQKESVIIQPETSVNPVFDGSVEVTGWTFTAATNIYTSPVIPYTNGTTDNEPGNLLVNGEAPVHIRWRGTLATTRQVMTLYALSCTFDPFGKRWYVYSTADLSSVQYRVSARLHMLHNIGMTNFDFGRLFAYGNAIWGIHARQFSDSAFKINLQLDAKMSNCRASYCGGVYRIATSKNAGGGITLAGCSGMDIDDFGVDTVYEGGVVIDASGGLTSGATQCNGVRVRNSTFSRYGGGGIVMEAVPAYNQIIGTEILDMVFINGGRGAFDDAANYEGYCIVENIAGNGQGSGTGSAVSRSTIKQTYARNIRAENCRAGWYANVLGYSTRTLENARFRSFGEYGDTVMVLSSQDAYPVSSTIVDAWLRGVAVLNHAGLVRSIGNASSKYTIVYAGYCTVRNCATAFEATGVNNSQCSVYNSVFTEVNTLASGYTTSGGLNNSFTDEGGNVFAKVTTNGFAYQSPSSQTLTVAPTFSAEDPFLPVLGSPLYGGGLPARADQYTDIFAQRFSINPTARGAVASYPTTLKLEVLVLGDSWMLGDEPTSYSPRGLLGPLLLSQGSIKTDFVGPFTLVSNGAADAQHAVYKNSTLGPDLTGNSLHQRIASMAAYAPELVVFTGGMNNLIGVVDTGDVTLLSGEFSFNHSVGGTAASTYNLQRLATQYDQCVQELLDRLPAAKLLLAPPYKPANMTADQLTAWQMLRSRAVVAAGRYSRVFFADLDSANLSAATDLAADGVGLKQSGATKVAAVLATAMTTAYNSVDTTSAGSTVGGTGFFFLETDAPFAIDTASATGTVGGQITSVTMIGPTNMVPNGISTITVIARDIDGNGVGYATIGDITISDPNVLEILYPLPLRTNVDGTATFQVRAKARGQAVVVAKVEGVQGTPVIVSVEANYLTTTITADQPRLEMNGQTALHVHAQYDDNTPASGLAVTINMTPASGLQLVPSTGVLDTNGNASFVITGILPGAVSITATVLASQSPVLTMTVYDSTDIVTVNATGGGTIKINLESDIVDLLKPFTRRLTDADQRSYFPTDKFFEFVAQMASDKEVTFLTKEMLKKGL